MFMTGPIATSLSERIGCRPVAVMGGLVGMVGTLLASFSDSIFKMYLTQGFLFGVGASLCYFPSVIILPQYFYKNLSMANGLVACGSGVGTMAMGPVINYVIENYGWRTLVRISAGLLLLCSLISLTYRPNEKLQRKPCGKTTIHLYSTYPYFRTKVSLRLPLPCLSSCCHTLSPLYTW